MLGARCPQYSKAREIARGMRIGQLERQLRVLRGFADTAAGTQCTCFTSTKVQILTRACVSADRANADASFAEVEELHSALVRKTVMHELVSAEAGVARPERSGGRFTTRLQSFTTSFTA